MSHADFRNLSSGLLALDQRRNRDSRDAWELFAEHRAIVTDHLARAGNNEQDKSLCLLGVGNANDVDLRHLATRFGRIDLFDWDDEAMQLGLQRQGIEQDPRFRAHGGVDLGGIAEAIASESAELPQLRLPRDDYDVVASLCLLTQLIGQLVRAVGTDHPRFLELVQSLRRRHFQCMMDHLRPGGLMFLVTDFVSSDTCPELIEMDAAQIQATADRWLEARNFFTGVNPRVLHHTLLNDPELAPRLNDVQLVRPWRWRLTERRAYAVCALKAIKCA